MESYKSLGVLRSLIRQVENSYLRDQLDEWVKECVVELGIETTINMRELEYMKGEKTSYLEHQKRSVAHKVGIEMLEKIADVETEPAPFGERTRYRILGIKGVIKQ